MDRLFFSLVFYYVFDLKLGGGMCLFHKWTKWEKAEREKVYYPDVVKDKKLKYIQGYQWRECEKCRLYEEREILGLKVW